MAVVAERGTLITFEGIGGSGKSTVAGEVVAWLKSQQLDVLFLKEPGGTSLGRELREILVNRDDWLAPWTEAFLFEADRAQTYSELVLDALQRGAVVVFDRGPYGTLAYQAAGRQLDEELVRAMNDAAVQGRSPDLAVVIDVRPEVGLTRKRAQQATDRFDAEPDLEYHRRVRAGYLEAAQRDGDRAVVVDGERPPDAVLAEVKEFIALRLGISVGR